MLSGTFLFLGKGAGGDYDKSVKGISKTRNKIQHVKSNAPYPNAENAEVYMTAISSYADGATKYRDSFLVYSPDTKGAPNNAEVSGAITADVNRLTGQYKELGIAIPESTPTNKFRFGFEAFGDKMVPKEVASEVEYQRKALAWMFDKLAEAKPSAITNVHRHKVDPVLDPSTNGLSTFDRNKARVLQKEAYYGLPLELTFTGSEQTLKQFLESLAQSKEYFFSVRALRVQNEKTEAPLAQADFEEAQPDTAPGGDFSPDDFGFGDGDAGESVEGGDALVEGGAPAPAEESTQDSGLVIKKVSGGEQVHVFLKLDLLVFKDPQKNKQIALPDDGKTKAQPKKPAQPIKKGDK